MTGVPVIMVAAVNRLGFIGNQGDLIVKCARDMQRFKELSKNAVVIMGRKTYESLPRALSGRSVVVLSENPRKIRHPLNTDANEVLCVGDMRNLIEAAHRLAALKGRDKIVIAGGGSVYKGLLFQAERIYLTRYSDETFGDAKFPIREFEDMVDAERICQISRHLAFYEGDISVEFEDYELTSVIEAVVGDFVKLRTGHRFRLSALETIIPLEDGVMLCVNGCAFTLVESEANLERLLEELDQLIDDLAVENVSIRQSGTMESINIDHHFLVPYNSK